MSGLQETFYIMAIIFMSVMFVLVIALVIAVFVIRAKINRIHDNIERKIGAVSSVAEKGGELAAAAGTTVVKGAKKVLRKAKRPR